MVRCDVAARLIRVRHSGKRKLRIPPGKLAIAQARFQLDMIASIRRNVQAIVNRIGSARRDQVNVNYGATGPGIALVDHVAVAINLQ